MQRDGFVRVLYYARLCCGKSNDENSHKDNSFDRDLWDTTSDAMSFLGAFFSLGKSVNKLDVCFSYDL